MGGIRKYLDLYLIVDMSLDRNKQLEMTVYSMYFLRVISVFLMCICLQYS